jgi:plastocyanin
MKRIPMAGALVTCALLSSPSMLRASAKTLHVTIDKVAFGNIPTHVQVGDTVEWSNRDFVAHTATAQDGSFDVDLMPGKSGLAVLKRSGKVRFYCRYHPTMVGEINVAQ